MKYELRDASGVHVATHERVNLADGKRCLGKLPHGTSGLGGLSVAELPLYGVLKTL